MCHGVGQSLWLLQPGRSIANGWGLGLAQPASYSGQQQDFSPDSASLQAQFSLGQALRVSSLFALFLSC